MVCYDIEVEPGLQPVNGEELNRGANQSHDARLDVHARGFWERQRSAYFDIRVCHPHADSYKDLTLKQFYKQQENEKKPANMLQGSSKSSIDIHSSSIQHHGRVGRLAEL